MGLVRRRRPSRHQNGSGKNDELPVTVVKIQSGEEKVIDLKEAWASVGTLYSMRLGNCDICEKLKISVINEMKQDKISLKPKV